MNEFDKSEEFVEEEENIGNEANSWRLNFNEEKNFGKKIYIIDMFMLLFVFFVVREKALKLIKIKKIYKLVLFS